MFSLTVIVFFTFLNAAACADRHSSNPHCNLTNEMTDEARKMFLRMHNKFRSLVARGKAGDALGGFAPKAAKMMKMISMLISSREKRHEKRAVGISWNYKENGLCACL
ncbi:unnamed protein product [Haemonchus placei]|uniref:SCP domain-containing protein n=1 Tax=Haemonchus placei TaxID=6290 RepID=A0A0N4X0F4_HAEPC|nr:unnamed protein product [Haemonchus placei]